MPTRVNQESGFLILKDMINDRIRIIAGVFPIHHVELFLVILGIWRYVNYILWLCNKISIQTALHCSHFATTSPHSAAETPARQDEESTKDQPSAALSTQSGDRNHDLCPGSALEPKSRPGGVPCSCGVGVHDTSAAVPLHSRPTSLRFQC